MPSTTRGSILISTANDIGEALVDKLGGVGYSPNEWKDKFNLCGIAPVDSAPALSVLADSAGTGDERGSILIATADAIGAILNKKYNVLRGFKPKEWASACRKMKALEEGSVASASIASFSDGADTVPLTSCVCSIDANLDGKSAVVCSHEKKNFANFTDGKGINSSGQITSDANRTATETPISIIGNATYKVVAISEQTVNFIIAVFNGSTLVRRTAGISNGSIVDTSGGTDLYVCAYSTSTVTHTGDKVMVISGTDTDVSTYEPYQAPTTYTADLGRAVLCGNANIITGSGIDNGVKIKLNSLTWSYNNTSYSYGFFDAQYNITDMTENMNFACTEYVNRQNSRNALADGEIGVYNKATSTRRLVIRDDSCATLEAFLTKIADYYLAYESTTDTPFTFEPVKIDSFEGVNNIWNDCGNTAVEYYQAPTPYTRKTATGGIANFSDQRTDLPLTKAIANIAPSIAGKSAVNLARAGKNLLDPTTKTEASATVWRFYFADGLQLKKGTYTISASVSMNGIYVRRKSDNTDVAVSYNQSYLTFTLSADLLVTFTFSNVNSWDGVTFQLEVGSAASTFEPYQAPATYTAELGETAYGGSVDFVSGEVQKTYGKYSITGQETGDLLAGTNNNGCRIGVRISGAQTPLYSGGISNIGENKVCLNSATWTIGSWCIYTDNKLYFVVPNEYTTFASALQYLVDNNATFVFPLATPTESAIPGRVISPIEGVNNYWNDAGGDTEIQYFENEA